MKQLFIEKHIKDTQYIKWGDLYSRITRIGKKDYHIVYMPFDVLFKITRKKAYSGRIPVYNADTKHFYAGFFRLIEII